jgi:hypothetical protein
MPEGGEDSFAANRDFCAQLPQKVGDLPSCLRCKRGNRFPPVDKLVMRKALPFSLLDQMALHIGIPDAASRD